MSATAVLIAEIISNTILTLVQLDALRQKAAAGQHVSAQAILDLEASNNAKVNELLQLDDPTYNRPD